MDALFLKRLAAIGEHVLMSALYGLSLQSDTQAMNALLDLYDADGYPDSFSKGLSFTVITAANERVSDCTHATLFALALSPAHPGPRDPIHDRLWGVQTGQATVDYAMPEGPILTPGQARLFNRAIHAMAIQVEGNKRLDGFLAECASLVQDPVVFERLLAAGADATAKGPTRRGGAMWVTAPELAIGKGNTPALRALLSAVPVDTALDDVAQEMTVNADGTISTGQNLASVVADRMALGGRDFDGLWTLHAVEEASDRAWDHAAGGDHDRRKTQMAALDLRANVLVAYLVNSAQRRIGWDPIQVKHLLGFPPDEAELALARRTTNGEVLELPPNPRVQPAHWARVTGMIFDQLITTALQAHCTPVLGCMADKMISLQGNLTRPVDQKYNAGPLGANAFTHLTAGGLTVHPINPDGPLNPAHFGETLALLDRLGLLKVEHLSGTTALPAFHSAAKHMGTSRDAALVGLLEIGLPPDVKNRVGQSAVAQLPAEEREAWSAIVRSFQARRSAMAALETVGLNPAEPTAKAPSP